MQTEQEISLPNIGDFDQVDVIEVHVSSGDTLAEDDPIITLESDKATMDIPAPASGTVEKVIVAVGDKISEGSPLIVLKVTTQNEEKPQTDKEESSDAITNNEAFAPALEETASQAENTASVKPDTANKSTTKLPAQAAPVMNATGNKPHASPSVRRFARELGVDLSLVTGTGAKNRIVKDDVKQFTKAALQSVQSGAGGAVMSASIQSSKLPDFSKFGHTETLPLTKINQLSAENLYQNWIAIPHVTLQEAADITELEAFRNQHKAQAKQAGFNLTITSFIVKAVASSLRAYPRFRSSLDWANKQLIVKDYIHIGVAVDTPNGLYVPVIKDADQKSLFAIAEELQEIAEKAKAKKLSPAEMQGSVFTVSSLGSLGSTGFTPIINAPEVAILGVSRSSLQASVFNDEIVPRLILPLSLSIDHRVIDGGDGARFCSHLRQGLSDIRTLLL